MSVGLSVCVCVQKVYCGKTADWIRMPFDVVSEVGRGMGVLDGGGDCRRGRAVLGVKFCASHCNQLVLCDAALPKSLWAVLALCLRCKSVLGVVPTRRLVCIVYTPASALWSRRGFLR